MKSSIINDGFISFMGDILAAGIMKDELEDVTRDELIQLFPVYYTEAINKELQIPLDDNESTGLSGGLKSAFKKIGQFTVASLKRPSVSLTEPARLTARLAGKKSAQKVTKFAESSKILKAGDAVNQYFVKNPQVAFAIAAVIPGLNIVAIAIAAGIAIASTEYGKMNQRKIEDLNKRYQDRALLAAETGQPIEEPPIYFDGEPKELLKIVNDPKFLEGATQEIKKNLVEKMGYPDNQATLLMAQKAAATSVLDIKNKIAKGEIQKIPPEGTGKKPGLTSLIIPAIAAYSLLG